MKKQVYEIDQLGLLKEIHVTELNESGVILDNDKKGLIIIDPPNGLYKPKWNGIKWLEGASKEEIENIKGSQSIELTSIEILKKQVEEQQSIIEELLFEVIPSLLTSEKEMI